MRTHLAVDKTEKQSGNLSEMFYRKRLTNNAKLISGKCRTQHT